MIFNVPFSCPTTRDCGRQTFIASIQSTIVHPLLFHCILHLSNAHLKSNGHEATLLDSMQYKHQDDM